MKLIKRTYRISTEQDILIKKLSKKLKISESELVRRAVRGEYQVTHKW